MAKNIGELVAKLKLDGQNFITGMDDAGKTVDGFDKKTMAVAKQLGKLGLAMGAAALAAGTYIGVQSVRAFAEFETSIANVATLLEAGPAGVPALMKGLQDAVLGLNPELGSATELADALYQVVSADLNLSLVDAKTNTDNLSEALGTGTDSLETQLNNTETAASGLTGELGDPLKLNAQLGATESAASDLTKELSGTDKLNAQMAFLENAAYAATAGVTTTFVAVDAATTVLNAFGLTSGDANRIFDEMFKTVELGKTTFEALASNIGKVSSTMASAKQPTKEMFAAIATLTKGIGSTEEATTALNAILMGIIKPGKEAAEMAKSLELEFDATALASKGLAQFLAEVKEKTGGNIEKMSALFQNVRALKGALLLAGSQSESFIKSLADMDEASGSVKTAFDKQALSLEHNVKAIGNLINKIKIIIGAPLAEIVKEQAQAILEWSEKNKEIIEEDIPAIAESTAKALGVIIKWMIASYKTRIEEDEKWKKGLEEVVLSLKNLGKVEKELSQESMGVHLEEVVFKYLTTKKYATLEQKDEAKAHKEWLKIQDKIKLEIAKTIFAEKEMHEDFLKIQKEIGIESIEAKEKEEEKKIEASEARYHQTGILLDNWTRKTELAAQERRITEELAEKGITEVTAQEWEKRWEFQKTYGEKWSLLSEQLNSDIMDGYGLTVDELKTLDEGFLTNAQTNQARMLLNWESHNANMIDDFELTVAEYGERFGGDDDSIVSHIKRGLDESIEGESGFKDWKNKVFSDYDSVMNSAFRGMQEGFDDQIYDWLSGRFSTDGDSIKAIWDSMWESMKRSMAQKLSEMATEIITEKVIKGGLGWLFDLAFDYLAADKTTSAAAGIWDVDTDTFARLHAGEMVVPEDLAAAWRDTLGAGLVEAPGIRADMAGEGIDVDAMAGGDLSGVISGAIAGMSEGMAIGLAAVGMAVAQGVSFGTAVSALAEITGLQSIQGLVMGSIQGGVPGTGSADLDAVLGVIGAIAAIGASMLGVPPIAVFAIPMAIDILGGLLSDPFADIGAAESEFGEALSGLTGLAEIGEAEVEFGEAAGEGEGSTFGEDPGFGEGEEGFRLGTGLEGLPYTGSFFGHEGEIIASPEESEILRSASVGGGDVHLHLTVKVDGAREDIIIDKIIPVIKDQSELGEQILYAKGVIEAEV